MRKLKFTGNLARHARALLCGSLVLAGWSCRDASPPAVSGDAGAGGGAWAGGAGGNAKGGSPGLAGGAGAGQGGDGGGGPFVPAGPPDPSSPVALHGQLAVQGTRLVDSQGNPVQLKGVSSMWLNWESAPFAESKAALQDIRDRWKLSVIRASMGTEQSGGYLDGQASQKAIRKQVETIIQNAIELGVYVIVDWHTEIAPEQQQDAVAFFSDLAARYGQYPNVIYEPYNEPNRHTPVPPATRGAAFTWTEIKAYHTAVVAAIRAQDSDNLIVLGTPQWSQRVDQAAADPVEGTNLLYTLHFYACTHKASFYTLGDMAIAKGIALFVTEFGATPADGGVPPNNLVCADETNLWWDWMATNGISGAAWKLEQCDDASCILGAGAKADGPWTDDVLTTDTTGTPVDGGVKGGGHGQLIVSWLRR